MSPERAWKATLSELELQMTRATYNTWLKDAELIEADEASATFTIGVPSDYARDWLENRLKKTISRTLMAMIEREPVLKFIVLSDDPPAAGAIGDNGHASTPIVKPPAKATSNPASEVATNLNEHYVFKAFVVGHNNRLAHAASLSVAERPGETYNPLFIYGGVGLGKTHLLHAIGNRCVQNGYRVLYVSSESFTNDLIASIRTQRMDEFRERYRTPDVLLIDDIQFIAGKESTQEEIFHTFNDLHSRGRQVVISSDRPPKAMVTLEERLQSRFEWGLMADIQLPDEETRMAILQQKAEDRGMVIPRPVLVTIAHHVRQNIRELEGALNKVIAYANLMDAPIDQQLVQRALADIIRTPDKVSVDQVLKAVSDYYQVSIENIVGSSRKRIYTLPRQVVMYLCRTETEASLPQIGARLGGRDHTTVMHGHDKITALIETNTTLRREILEIKAALYNTNG